MRDYSRSSYVLDRNYSGEKTFENSKGFTNPNIRYNIEKWIHPSNKKLMDGGRVYEGSITGDKINLTSYLAIHSNEWESKGIQIQYNYGTPRFYCGNGSEEYFKYDGTNTAFSTAKSGGGIYLRQGGDLIMGGGAAGNPSLIRFADQTVPGEIRFEQSGDDTNYHHFYKTTSEDGLIIEPIGLTSPSIYIGTGSHPYLRIKLITAAVEVGGRLEPLVDDTHTLGSASHRWSDMRSVLINGSDYCFDNEWRILESEKYQGYPKGIAIGNTGFVDGKPFDGSPDIKPLFVITEDFIEFHGNRITKEQFGG